MRKNNLSVKLRFWEKSCCEKLYGEEFAIKTRVKSKMLLFSDIAMLMFG